MEVKCLDVIHCKDLEVLPTTCHQYPEKEAWLHEEVNRWAK